MPTMLKRLIHIAFFLALATAAGAQYLQGTLSGGTGVPGTKTRSPLTSMERAANNLEGVTIVTDTFGNQRLAYYVRVLDTCVNYNPLVTIGNLPLSSFVYQCGSQDSLFYIDWKGDAIFINAGAGAAACDQDWLVISDNSCPDTITDSIYHYKYAAIGARYVWPSAEFLVNDSTGAAIQVLSGSRNVRQVFYDNNNVKYSTIDQNGASTLWYLQPTGTEFRILTAAGGTPENPAGPFVNQFSVNPPDAPLATIQAYQYPNTRTDTATIRNFLYTDANGKFRSQALDTLIQVIVDSIAGDTSLQYNWYTKDGTTTSKVRTATIDSAAIWQGDDPEGFLYWEMGSLTGGRLLVDTASAIYQSGLGGTNRVQADPQGIDITTSSTASRAVNITSDTVNMISSFDPTLMKVNLLSDGTYFSADSVKVVGIGQFPAFPSLNLDGTEKGILYDPSQSSGQGQVNILSGDGVSGEHITLGFYPKYAQMDMATSSNQIRYGLRVIGADANSTNRWLSLQTENDSLTIQEFNDEHYLISSTDLQANISDQLRFLADSAQWIEGTVQTETGMKFIYGSTPTGWMKRFDGSGSDGDFIVSDGDVWRISNATAEGYVLQNGNSFGTEMIIGTNDNNTFSFETNAVKRYEISSGATTGGNTTQTAITANTAATENVKTIKTNSTGTPGSGFGAGILFQLESSTTDNRDAAQIRTTWTTATDATRTSNIQIMGVAGGAALSNYGLFSSTGLTIGNGTADTYRNNSVQSANVFQLSSSNSSSGALTIVVANAAAAANGRFVNNGTHTSSQKLAWEYTDDFTPTSGNGTMYNIGITPTINQTGGANGVTGGILFSPTFTAVGATWSALAMSISNSSAKFLNQTGANTTSTHVGAFGIGSTTVPTDKLEVTGNVALLTAGNKLKIATGANASMGTATLVGGTVTVNTTAVSANSIIFTTCNTPGGTQGFLSAPVANIIAGTSFVINSSSGTDTSTVNWLVIN